MQQENEQSAVFGMELTEYTKSLFLSMARWTKFLAILGFVLLGLLMIGLAISFLTNNGLFHDSSDPQSIGELISAFLGSLVVTGIYFYPTYALLMYSTKVKRAILATNQGEFDLSIKLLKNSFKYIGILMIIVLGLYGIGIIFMLLSVLK